MTLSDVTRLQAIEHGSALSDPLLQLLLWFMLTAPTKGRILFMRMRQHGTKPRTDSEADAKNSADFSDDDARLSWMIFLA